MPFDPQPRLDSTDPVAWLVYAARADLSHPGWWRTDRARMAPALAEIAARREAEDGHVTQVTYTVTVAVPTATWRARYAQADALHADRLDVADDVADYIGTPDSLARLLGDTVRAVHDVGGTVSVARVAGCTTTDGARRASSMSSTTYPSRSTAKA